MATEWTELQSSYLLCVLMVLKCSALSVCAASSSDQQRLYTQPDAIQLQQNVAAHFRG